MEHIEIRETMPEDAEKLLAYMQKVGAETDNLTFGKEGLPVTVEQEQAYLATHESLCRTGIISDKSAVESGDWRQAS